MAHFRLVIDCDNAAFGEDNSARSHEIARILHEVSASLRRAPASVNVKEKMRDVNGNAVGYWSLTEGDARNRWR